MCGWVCEFGDRSRIHQMYILRLIVSHCYLHEYASFQLGLERVVSTAEMEIFLQRK